MLEISDETKEFLMEDVIAEPFLDPIYKKILNNRNEDKSIELWVCWARTKRILINLDNFEEDNIDDGGSWYKIYGYLFDDDDETDRTIAAKTWFLMGWLEITIFKKDWIENTIVGKDYSQFMDTIHKHKNDFLQKDQFFLSEHLNYSIDSLERWQNYLAYKEKIPKDIASLQSISDNQKDILTSIIIKDEEITDLETHINDTINDSFSPKQKIILEKIIKKGATPSSIKRYINELKLKVDDKEFDLLEQIIAFVKNNEKLIFLKNPRFLQKKRFAKKPWKVFADNDLHSTYHQKDIDDVTEKKFPKHQEDLKTINFHRGPGGKRPSIANMITWINYLSTSNYRDKQMKNDDSIFKHEKKKRDDAKADKTIIPENIKAILSKIKEIGYKDLIQEDKHTIDQSVKDSPKIKWEFEAAKLTFTENRIVENYHKRKALKKTAKKEESLWESFIKKLQNFSEQMRFPQAAVSLVTAGIATIIIFGVYTSGPAKFNVDLKITAETQIRSGSNEFKEFTLNNGGELNSGDKFRIITNIDKNAFVYVISKDSSDVISLINKEPISAVNTLTLPSDNEQWFVLDSNIGNEELYIIASKREIKDIDDRIEKLKKSGISNINKIFKKSKIESFKFKHN
ncbi:MAG: DUF4384 domain-containing protein [Desulfobacula sp.]|nr:DUF4384 domain-containing protein [Desulfobacula sp.]